MKQPQPLPPRPRRGRAMSDHVTRQLAEACRELDLFQVMYDKNSMGCGMPGNELYSSQLMQIVTRHRAALAAYDAATKEKPEPPTIFRCEEGEHKGMWFRRTGERGSRLINQWPYGTLWICDGCIYGPDTMADRRWCEDCERLELLPPVEVGQQWRWGSVTICIECRDKLAVNESWFGKDAATGSIVSRSASELYRNWTLIRTCPSCGAECDEPDKHCPPRPTPEQLGDEWEIAEDKPRPYREGEAFVFPDGGISAESDYDQPSNNPHWGGRRWIVRKKQPATPPRPDDQFFEGEWWRASEYRVIASGEVFMSSIIGRCLIGKEAAQAGRTEWIMVRKYPDTLTADELVALGLKGARATRRDGVSLELNGECFRDGENYSWLNSTGCRDGCSLAMNQNFIQGHLEATTLTIPTPRGDVTYKCEGGVCTRVREPKVEVGDVVECIKAKYVGREVGELLIVTDQRKDSCVIGGMMFSYSDIPEHFRVVRRRGE